MPEEQNTETTPNVAPAATEEASQAPAEPTAKPRRRTARKAKEAVSADEPAPEAAAEAKAKPVRRTRARKAPAKESTEEPQVAGESPAGESPEVVQARALAQVSQASVVRRQRRAAERAAEMLASGGDAPAATEAKPAMEAPAKPGDAARTESAAAPEQIAIPFVDPALRPHRRGRKPKAYVEADKAAAAAAAAAAQRAEAVHADPASPAGEADAPAPSPAADVHPGRGTRAKRASGDAEQASQPAAPQGEEGGSAPAAPKAPRQEQGRQQGQQRRQHQNRRDGNQGQGGQGHARQDRDQRDFGDRRDRRQQNGRNKRNNNRFVPTEPSLTRDELSAYKVAELREKAKEFDVDTSGKKKAELVEEVYAAAAKAEGFRDIEGILDITNEGFGYIRAHGYMPSRDDAFVAAQLIRAAGLRPGDHISGTLRPSRANDKFPGLAKLRAVNGVDPELARRRPKFADLTPIYPNEPLKMEHGRESITGRAIDIVSPIGKGQRGLIVSPPKAGKTTILKKICQSISANNPEVHLICLLVDERPEEVTDMQRSIKGDVVASTFDMPADNHTRVSELVIERAKRIVELGGDVVVVLDSITRLARAYNLAAPASGRILSGGVDSAALYPPKRFLGAARNIENGGSLTIISSALVETGSKMDEVIFEEFKGTGNMELRLSRELADKRLFPAIDINASGTRREELITAPQELPIVYRLRRLLGGMEPEQAYQTLVPRLKKTATNRDFLAAIVQQSGGGAVNGN